MKLFFIFVCLSAGSGAAAAAVSDCGAVTVAARIQVPAGEFTARELLRPSACAAWRDAAAGVHLGQAPLPGSPRVFSGDAVRSLLGNLRPTRAGENDGLPAARLEVPERVVVERAGARASCAEMAARLAGEAAPSDMGKTEMREDELRENDAGVCGAAGRIPASARIELRNKVWNASLGAWDLTGRCVPAAQCVPFLVRLPGAALDGESIGERFSSRLAPHPHPEAPALVRPGQTVSLVWDQDGIRVTVPATCLDRGGAGQAVRARIGSGGRQWRAIVVSAHLLRAAS